jgi:hypothetical protein
MLKEIMMTAMAVNSHCTAKKQWQEYEKKGKTHQSVQWFCPCPHQVGICTNLMQISQHMNKDIPLLAGYYFRLGKIHVKSVGGCQHFDSK